MAEADAAKEISALLETIERAPSEGSGASERAVAADRLFPLVYAELRRVAAARLARLPAGQTLQATALVHEAYVELVGRGDPGWSGRAHFFGAAARAMREILIDAARRKRAGKRGGGARHEDVDAIAGRVAARGDVGADDALATAEALERLASEHPRRAEVATLRVLGGLSEEEIARLFDVSTRTVEREWRFARAFLRKELS